MLKMAAKRWPTNYFLMNVVLGVCYIYFFNLESLSTCKNVNRCSC